MSKGLFKTLNVSHPLFDILRSSPIWWKLIKSDRSLYVAIRKDNYLNVYYCDGNLAKIELDREGNLLVSVHTKYCDGLESAALSANYRDITAPFLSNPKETLKKLKSNIRKFYQRDGSVPDSTELGEKYIQYEWAVARPGEILDLEFAYTKKGSNIRMDIIRCCYGEITFIELKRINDNRMLRKDPSETPEIVSQMIGYESFIRSNAQDILEYYRKVFLLKVELGLPLPDRMPEKINTVPVLSIADIYPEVGERRSNRIDGINAHVCGRNIPFETEYFTRLHRTYEIMGTEFKESERRKDANRKMHGTDANLYSPIRNEAIRYFDKNGIKWWSLRKGTNEPSNHSLSSQIQCLNHLFAIRDDEHAVLSIIRAIFPDISFERVLKVPFDAAGTEGYIAFEFVHCNRHLLHENYETRGENCTSVDAVVYAVDNVGRHILIPIEWKYTETYDGKEAYEKSIRRYPELVGHDSNIKEWVSLYRADPYYELARQTLLVERMITDANPDFPVDDYRHVIVCPDDNPLSGMLKRHYLPTLKSEGLVRIISQEQFMNPLLSHASYPELISYLSKRYWK